ncbi:hypothetical protein [Arthrobacter sp. H5]|uniref:hypothetical protein n=1 Tax=Arthrobacter sp. H5 TaxID=1267973 RepID=UPI0004B0401E|nr:hypothetical protein [Arthrobacter sp. H5]
METQLIDPDQYVALGVVAGGGLALAAGFGALGVTVAAGLGLVAGAVVRLVQAGR